MHELGVAQALLDIIADASGGARVRRVVVEIGRLTAVMPDALRFCFDLASQDTVADGATLEIIETPGRARCRACAGELNLDRPFGRCVCGASDLEWLAGEELRVRELEVI